MKKFTRALLVAIPLIALSSCGVNPDKATRILSSQGLTDIEIGGYAFFGCSKDDDWGSNFSAKDVHGQPVSGVVCGGWLKGYTVRFD